MNNGFQVIKIQPSLPCVYHGCDEEATVAIAYAVSEREWRIVPTCKQHTVAIQPRYEQPEDNARK